jgi:hypothetical protein
MPVSLAATARRVFPWSQQLATYLAHGANGNNNKTRTSLLGIQPEEKTKKKNKRGQVRFAGGVFSNTLLSIESGPSQPRLSVRR